MSDKYDSHDAAQQRDAEIEATAIEIKEEEIAMSTDVTVRAARALATPTLTVQELLTRRHTIVDAMNMAMEKDVHYGRIPGVNKPALLKPGAEMLCQLFQLAPHFPDERQSNVTDPASGHLDVRSLCELRHIPSGLVVAEGHGSCSTREKKYAYRSGAITCPTCGASEVRKSKQQGKDEFYCWKKQGGCGAVFPHWIVSGEERTENPQYLEFAEQLKDSGKRIDNPDLPDQYNTVLKMSEKRSLIAATLMATGASDVFTQDIEDTPSGTGDSSTHEPVKADPSPVPVGYLNWGPAKLADEFVKAGVDPEWLSQVVEAKYGSGKAFADLDREQKNLVGQALKTAFARLWETLGPKGSLEFPGPKRAEVQEVFATVLDGVVLPGPPWRMHPPNYDEGEEAYEAKVDDAVDPDVEDIPFGEPAAPAAS